MSRRAIVAGGSIGGLFAAAALARAGWQVDVFERSDVELAGRGAGIVTHDVLIDALRTVGADLDDLGVAVETRTAFDKSGSVVATLPYHQIVTSWDRIHQLLRGLIPDGHHHLGRHVQHYTDGTHGVTVNFADGGTAEADVLVGADGFRSAVRAQMLPDVVPRYSGYVVWRALAAEATLSPEARDSIFPTFAFYAPAGTQIIGYPIAGPGNALAAGNRRYNFVWYARAEGDTLRDMLTDDTGRHHAVSIPPPLVRDDVLEVMHRQAQEMLPPAFTAILAQSERPFFTPIYDHHSPIMAQGRVALAGDAACVARPHVGMGVTKAAEDALALARHLGGHHGEHKVGHQVGQLTQNLQQDPARNQVSDIDAALGAYSAERVPASRAAFDRARQLGGWIFEPDAANPDGATNARLSEIMRLTAVTVQQRGGAARLSHIWQNRIG